MECYFYGLPEVYDYLRHSKKLKMDRILNLRSLVDKSDSKPFILHVGRNVASKDTLREVRELLFLQLIPSEIRGKIYLTSFLSTNALHRLSPVYKEFAYVRLPNMIEEPLPVKYPNNGILVKAVHDLNFKGWYLWHLAQRDMALYNRLVNIVDNNIKQLKYEDS